MVYYLFIIHVVELSWGDTECDVPQAREDPIVTLVSSNQGESVPSLQTQVEGPGAQRGDPTRGLEVARPVLRGLNPLAVDMNECL